MKIRCLACGELYVCDITNTIQIGPIIETKCPLCKKENIRNFSKFVALQLEDDINDYYRLSRSVSQISLAQKIASAVNEDNPRKKK